jgi:hypothetical protein
MNKIKKAYKLGKQAFREGRVCVPCYDARLMKLLQGNKVGEGIPVIEAWSKGWTEENLKSED